MNKVEMRSVLTSIFLGVFGISSVVTAVLGVIYILYHTRGQLMDTVSFYTGAKIVAGGYGFNLYDVNVQQEFQKVTTGLNDYLLPFRNPPFALLGLIPLSLLPYDIFHFSLMGINLLIAFWAAKLLTKHFRLRGGVVLFTILGYSPFFYSFIMGQYTVFIFLIWVTVYLLVNSGKPFWAGILTSLMAVKPQFLLLSPLSFLIVEDKRKYLFGFLSGIVGLFIFSLLIVGPGSLVGYPEFLELTEQAKYGSDLMWQTGLFTVLNVFNPSGNYGFTTLALINIVISMVVYIYLIFKKRGLDNNRYYAGGTLLLISLLPHQWESDLVPVLFTLLFILALWLKSGKKVFIVVFALLYLAPLLRRALPPYVNLFVNILIAAFLFEAKYFETATKNLLKKAN